MKKVRYLAGILISIFASSLCFSSQPTNAAAASLTVQTDKGLVRGTQAQNVNNFYNVPYAAPPVNELRWQPPHAAQPWSGVRDASAPGNACMQGDSGALPPNVQQSEDCLYLNVSAPTNAQKNSKKPVMVWLHGGGFTADTASAYNPARMVDEGDVIVVSANYRLGIFGAYAQKGLAGEGTFGLQDQQAALRWVKKNIANFGGDPRNVTLFGESAGAISACGQLSAPGAAGLFQKVIMESGSCDTNVSLTAPGTAAVTPNGTKLFESVQTAEQKSKDVAAALGCDTVDCLRKKDASTVQKYMMTVVAPAYGTSVLPKAPWDAIKSGAAMRVPVLSGATQDESRLVIMTSALTGFPVTEERYDDVLQQAFGDKQNKIRKVYSPENYRDDNGAPSPALALAALQTDRDFVCPQYATDTKLAWRMPVYSYNFSDPQALSSIPSFIPGFPMGASHTGELYDLFDMPPPLDSTGVPRQLTPKQQQLAKTMRTYWTSFARTGRPEGTPHWPAYLPLARATLDLQPGPNGIKPIDGNRQHHCEVWQTM